MTDEQLKCETGSLNARKVNQSRDEMVARDT